MSLVRSTAASPAGSVGSGMESQGSHHSGAVSYPTSAARRKTGTPLSEDGNDPSVNPFKMPPDNDIFQRRDQERQRKKALREKQKTMKVHEKMTYAAKVNHKTRSMIRPQDSDEEQREEDRDKAVAVKDDPQFVIAVTRDRHVEKESLAEYINKKREMFLVQYSLGVKRDEMRKLEEIAQLEEKKLESAEQYLEEDAAMFDEFLRENDKNSVDAIQIAEAETKSKLDKVADIKRITTQMMGIKSEISKYEELLKEYQLYKKFLDDVSPEEVKKQRMEKRKLSREARRKRREGEASSAKALALLTNRAKGRKTPKSGKSGRHLSADSPSAQPILRNAKSGQSRHKLLETKRSFDVQHLNRNKLLETRRSFDVQHLKVDQTASNFEQYLKPDIGLVFLSNKPIIKKSSVSQRGSEDGKGSDSGWTDEEESEEEPDLWFTDPQQLLDIFAELEEQNLSLIQNSQETEEALEEMRQTIKETKRKMEKETSVLKEQIDKLNSAISKEEMKAHELEMKAKMFSFGEFKQEDQDKMLAALNRKVADVYGACIGQNEANISTLQMLTNIENRLEELFEMIELMPSDKVEAAEKAKEKERRLKAREEKMEQQRLHQEERVKKALERAKAEPKKKTGKKLVFRSEPPVIKKKDDGNADKASREEEELAYFFT